MKDLGTEPGNTAKFAILRFMKPHRSYQLKNYNPNWANEFKKKAQLLRSIFGDEVIDIQHIGSTSIPGMMAKPQIDILVIVKDLTRVKNYYDAMSRAGFTPRGTDYVGVGDEYFTEDAPSGERVTSVHVFPQGHPKISEYLNLRDYLKNHKQDRDLYIETKKKLYQQHSENYAAYDSGKNEVIKTIIRRVNEWAQRKRFK